MRWLCCLSSTCFSCRHERITFSAIARCFERKTGLVTVQSCPKTNTIRDRLLAWSFQEVLFKSKDLQCVLWRRSMEGRSPLFWSRISALFENRTGKSKGNQDVLPHEVPFNAISTISDGRSICRVSRSSKRTRCFTHNQLLWRTL